MHKYHLRIRIQATYFPRRHRQYSIRQTKNYIINKIILSKYVHRPNSSDREIHCIAVLTPLIRPLEYDVASDGGRNRDWTTGTSTMNCGTASLSESVDLVRVTVFLLTSTVTVLVPDTIFRRNNVLSWRFKTAVRSDLSINLTSFRVAVSVVFVLTNFGPEFVVGIPLIPVADTFRIELLRERTAFRDGSFFQCVSTRAFTFFKSIVVLTRELQFSFELVVFLSFGWRDRSVWFIKLPSAGRRVAAVVVRTAFLTPPSPALIKFYAIE